jgi:hypothetical protein
LLVDDDLPEFFERRVHRDSHDVGARRHHFAHHFVAEFHHRLDKLAVLLVNKALFGSGLDQGFDVLRRRGRFFSSIAFVRDFHQRIEKKKHGGCGLHRQRQRTQQRNHRSQPPAARAPVENLRNAITRHQHQ